MLRVRPTCEFNSGICPFVHLFIHSFEFHLDKNQGSQLKMTPLIELFVHFRKALSLFFMVLFQYRTAIVLAQTLQEGKAFSNRIDLSFTGFPKTESKTCWIKDGSSSSQLGLWAFK